MNMNIKEKTEKNKLADTLLLLSAGSVFIWGIVCCIINNMCYEPVYGRIFLYIIIILATLRIIFMNRYTAAVSLVTGLITAVLILNSVYTDPYIAGFFKDTFVFFKDFFLYIGGYEQYIPAYESVANWGLCILLSVFVFVFTAVSFQFFALLGLAAVTFGVILSAGGSVYGAGFLACMFAVLLFLTQYLHTKALKKISQPRTNLKRNKITSVLCGVAIVFLCAGAAYMIPSPNAGFKDIVADTVIFRPLKAANKLITSFFTPKYFSFTSTGYLGKDRRLGGDVVLDDEIVMEVKLNRRERTYLSGNVNDTYTGYSWENTAQENQPYSFADDMPGIDFIELMFSNLMMSLDNGEFDPLCQILENPEKIFDFWYADRCEYIEGGTLTIQMQQSLYDMRSIEVNIKDARTFSVFSHSMIFDVTKDGVSPPLLKDGQGNLSVKKLMQKNTAYTIYYRLDPTISYWSDIKNHSREGIYKELRDALEELHEKYNFSKNQISVLLDESLDEDEHNLHMFKMYPAGEMYYNPEISMNYEDLLTNVLIPRAEAIYSRYTSLPENFPERIGELAKDITAEAENDYRKAVKIMNYLKTRYPYTLTPGDTPEDRDFVDYFLFDLQKGYCTSFASAFVTMCRSIGLPARYVEGYVTPFEKNENGVYVVTHKEGHVWGEVYFEGYGWIQFEPTPSADSAGMPEMLPSSEQYLPNQPEVYDSPGINNGLDKTGNTQNFLSEKNDNNSGDTITQNTELYTPVNTISTQGIILFNLSTAVIIIAAAVILFVTVRVIQRRTSEEKICRKPNREAVVLYFYILLKYLRFFSCEKRENETVSQYIDRCGIRDKFPTVSEAAEIFSKACYSGSEISENERNRVKCAVEEIDSAVRHSVGRGKYAYYKYIYRII